MTPNQHQTLLQNAANELRGSMDAAEYKHVVLGLIFLKHISDTFHELHIRRIADTYHARRAQRTQALPGLPAHLYHLFPDHLQTTPQGPIPAGWQLGCVADLCSKIENGGTPRRREAAFWGGEIDWFTTSELADGPLIASKERITAAGLSKSSCKLWNPGTVLIALYASPTVGRLGILETPAASNQACSGLVAKPEIGNLFLFHALLATRDRLRDIAVGAAQQNISQQVVRDHRVIQPPADTIAAFNRSTAPLWQQQVECANAARSLTAIRDTLLPTLLC